MNYLNILTVLSDEVKTIGVKFPGTSTIYTYATNLDLKKGDLVVAYKKCKNEQEQELFNENRLAVGLTSVGLVAEVHEYPQLDPKATYEYMWIVQKIDPSAFIQIEKLKAKLADEIQRKQLSARRQEILDNLDPSTMNMLNRFSNDEFKLIGIDNAAESDDKTIIMKGGNSSTITPVNYGGTDES